MHDKELYAELKQEALEVALQLSDKPYRYADPEQMEYFHGLERQLTELENQIEAVSYRLGIASMAEDANIYFE